jgi:hypothetical protein
MALENQTPTSYDYGWKIDEVEAGKKDSSSFFIDPTTEQPSTVDAFIVLASDPNNKTLKVTVEDSTINTNKNIQAISWSDEN